MKMEIENENTSIKKTQDIKRTVTALRQNLESQYTSVGSSEFLTF